MKLKGNLRKRTEIRGNEWKEQTLYFILSRKPLKIKPND